MLKNGRPARYGFVCFTTLREAVNAIIGMDGRQIGRRKLKVRLYQTKEERQLQEQLEKQKLNAIKQRKHSNLYVENLDVKIFSCDQQLFEAFKCFGDIISSKVSIIIF